MKAKDKLVEIARWFKQTVFTFVGIKARHISEIEVSKNRPYLVKGLLLPKQVSLLAAPPNTGKSSIVAALLAHVSQGIPFAGLRVKKAAVMFATNTEYGPAKGFKVVMKRRFKVDKKDPKSISQRQRSQSSKISKGNQTQLLNPLTGSDNFGFLRCPKNCEYLPICLFLGFHNAASNGFGSKHIWNGHSNHLISQGFSDISQVGHFLGIVFQSSTQVFCENNFQETGRVTVVHQQYGTVVLEVRRKYGRPCWSIITAHQGVAIGEEFFGSVKAALPK